MSSLNDNIIIPIETNIPCPSSLKKSIDSTDFFNFESIENENPRFESIDNTRFESIVLDLPVTDKSQVNPVIKENDYLEKEVSIIYSCLIGSSIGIFIITLLSLTIAYLVFTIISLCKTSYKDQKDECNESNAWIYILINLISGIIIVGLTKNKKEKIDKNVELSISTIILIGMMIWGCYELFGIKCIINLKKTLLYTMLQINVISRIIINLLMLVIFICYYYTSQADIVT